jgi:hypothetical protein
MAATITQFRKDLFHFAEQALEGNQVEFLYRGVVFKVTPEKKKSKLEKLIGQPVLAPNADIEESMLPGMEAEWNKDWSEF